MEVFIDSANVERISAYRQIGLISGVTTNPEILAVDGVSEDPSDALRGVIAAIDGGYVFAQVMSRDPRSQVDEARLLQSMGPNMVIKVIMDAVGLQSIPMMVEAGIRVSATAVNTVPRAILSAECGAEFIIPYYGWLQDVAEKPLGLLEDIAAVYRAQGYQTKLHAYCRRVEDITAAAKAGAWGVLLAPADLDRFFNHAQTEQAVLGHRAAWEKRYGKTNWLTFLAR